MGVKWLPTEREVQAGFQALADPTRRTILALLNRGGPQPVGAMLGQFDVSWSGISRHLRVLRSADLVSATRSGKQVIYSLNRERLGQLLEELAGLCADADEPVARPLQDLQDVAVGEAQAMDHDYIGSEHLLLALLRHTDTTAGRALAGHGVTWGSVREAITRRLEADGQPSQGGLLDDASWVLARARAEARKLGHAAVGGAALLLAILDYPNERACRVLDDLGVDAAQLRADVLTELQGDGTDATNGELDLGGIVDQMQGLVDALRTASKGEGAGWRR